MFRVLSREYILVLERPVKGEESKDSEVAKNSPFCILSHIEQAGSQFGQPIHFDLLPMA